MPWIRISALANKESERRVYLVWAPKAATVNPAGPGGRREWGKCVWVRTGAVRYTSF